MEVRVFETSKGPVPVWGNLSGFSAERPLLFVIRGAFADFDQLFGLTEALPEADVAYVHLPGMHTPFFATDGIDIFAKAFDEVLAHLGHSKAVVFGLSLGGVVAMAMKCTALQTLLLADTPLSTKPMWMLPAALRPLIKTNKRGAQWVWRLLGISETQVVNRDYRHLLVTLTVPTGVIFASDALGAPRPLDRDPSAVCDDDRALYRAHPKVSARIVENTGHQIASDAGIFVLSTLRRLLAAQMRSY